MELTAVGNNVLLERVRPVNALLDGLALDDSDALFIWKVKGVGAAVKNAEIVAGVEVALIGQVIPFDPVMYGDGQTKLFVCKDEQVICIVKDRESWSRPSILVGPSVRVMSGKERQAMHAGAARSEMVS